jgi:glycine C-acetyltransferase
MYGKIQQHLQKELNTIEQNGIFKKEHLILRGGLPVAVR